ncbi:MAG: class I SAM-dependent methyltransferase [Cyclobacteriaceae bacterium]
MKTRLQNRISNEWIVRKNKVLKLFRKLYSDQHQLTSTTFEDRYPELFEESRRALTDFADKETSILSFGCSTGEECFSLRKYFTESTIIGVDINRRNLVKARKKNSDQKIRFIYSSEENIKNEGPYRIIFCLSVLCRWEDTKDLDNCEKIYPFSKFQDTVNMLSEKLLPGGLLVIYNSNFAFEDTDLYTHSEYVTIDAPSVSDSGFVTKFDRRGNRVPGIHKSCIYRKRHGIV